MSARHARFIETPLAFAGAMAAGQTVPYAQMTNLADLQAARAEEDAKRGSAGGFVAMMVVGALGGFVAGPILLYVSLLAGLSGSGGGLSALFIAGLVTMGVGVVLFGVGLGLMIATIVRNSKASHNIRVIDRRTRELQQMQQRQYQQPYAPQPYAPQPQYAPPPSAPPPPPQQGFLNVEPTLELASF